MSLSASSSGTALVYDPQDPAVRMDPFPLYRRLQDAEPLHWSPVLKSWILTRYDDVKQVALNRDMSPDRLTPFFKTLPDAQRSILQEVIRYLNLWLVFRDPPEHTRLRRLLQAAFTPRAIEGLRPNIASLVEELLDRLEERSKTQGRVDLIADFAMLLPALVIMDMLGVPRDKLADIKAWSDDMVVFIGSARGVPDKYERARHGAQQMSGFFRGLIAERRAEPREDFISALIAARDETAAEGPERLSEDELVATCMLLLFAGHETTTNLIGNAALMLMRNPEQREKLQTRPDLIVGAVEEFLRYDGPSNSLARVVATTHEMHGATLKEGERVFAMLNAANRDPRQFEDADRLDIERSPNRHLTFGQGIHFCLGATLARNEGQLAINGLLERFPHMRPAEDEPEQWMDALIMRGMRRLPVDLV